MRLPHDAASEHTGACRRTVPRIDATWCKPGCGQPSVLCVDWDCCWIDAQPITTLDQWRSIVAHDRLGAVEGSFALAWSDAAEAIHLARDGIGGRTLFYAETGDGLLFASSISALLATGRIARQLETASLVTYLCTAYLPGRETLVRGVFELLPGEQLSFDRNGLRRTAFWQLPTDPPGKDDETTLSRELRRRLEAAVRRALPEAGAPVAAFLSGGLDSSLVVALAGRLHDTPVRTFSVSFGADYANELPFSSMVAAHCATAHTIVELSPAAVLDALDSTIGRLSDPIGDPLTVPNALLFERAAQSAGVVLNGEGGDPCFGGPKNLPMVLAELYQQPGIAHSRAANYLRSHLKCYDDLDDMLGPAAHDALAARSLEDKLAPLLHDPRWPDFVSRLQAMNITLKGAHHILPKVDALSAPAGVLPRAPLFDHRVVAFSLRLRPKLKLNGAVEKYLLKQAVRDLLPGAIVDRPKSGMLVPVEAWFRGPMRTAAHQRLLDGLAPSQLFDRAWLEKLLAGKLGGLRPRHGAKIWQLLTLEAWLRRVLAQ